MSEIEGLPHPYAEVSPYELEQRREVWARRTEFIDMQVELGRAQYLLKRIAGWLPDNPLPDPQIREEAVRFLKGHGHKLTDMTQKPLDI